ncbi:ABC transporter substrate-binding protein [Labrys wisconsinensis]|uniref:Iron complex transport system substrate-binding protein n=1 Tax=Labrys wisconsinensis TaxID=425677 RepID=A0ABU0JLE4_9HYPH|nr:ABC transporter substrate-binding protein [Labrys wisconsinensis]MDQ0473957.1 iron complex transport system substrate-binding protein [Labrys wisconsinensis]
MRRAFRLFSLAGLFATVVGSTALAQDAGRQSVVDDRGIAVEVPAHPQRIAAISYLATDVAFALGIKPVATTYMMAGRDPDFLLGLTKDIKQIGQRAKPNLELLSDAKPDLIVAIRRYTVGNAEQLQKIAPYLAYNMELLSESYEEVAELAKILGKPERGEQLNADFKQHLRDFSAKAPKDVHPRFVIMWGGDTPFAFHTENTAASIVAALGGDNIAGPMPQGGRFGIDLSLETLLEKDPQVIFVMDGGPDRPHENNPIWQQLSAVRDGRVHYVGDQWAETNGPIAREIVLREAAHYLYPDTFPAVDVRAEAARLVPADLRK